MNIIWLYFCTDILYISIHVSIISYMLLNTCFNINSASFVRYFLFGVIGGDQGNGRFLREGFFLDLMNPPSVVS